MSKETSGDQLDTWAENAETQHFPKTPQIYNHTALFLSYTNVVI